jgi:hypothetical protein
MVGDTRSTTRKFLLRLLLPPMLPLFRKAIISVAAIVAATATATATATAAMVRFSGHRFWCMVTSNHMITSILIFILSNALGN